MLLPGATEAEPWEVWTTGADAQCLQACRRPDENAPGRQAVLALPVAQVVALPLWLQETDAKQFGGMIELQLEARGLQPRVHAPIFEWSIIAQEELRTLVLVAVLAASLPEELETHAYAAFELSARCFALPADALVLWTEQDRLVAAVTRGEQLAYFQALTESRLTTRVLQDLTCVVAALHMQEVIGPLQHIIAWTELTPEEGTALAAALGAPVRQAAKPRPALPRQSWNLTPARVDEAKRQRITRHWQARAALLLGVLALGIMAALGLRLLLTAHEVGQLKQWQAGHAPALQRCAGHPARPGRTCSRWSTRVRILSRCCCTSPPRCRRSRFT